MTEDDMIFISIHALLAESDISFIIRHTPSLHFYPRSPCGERQLGSCAACFCAYISIHALLAESDRWGLADCSHQWRYFYPRSPCGERPFECKSPAVNNEFLSTLSLRRATRWWRTFSHPRSYFYPRSPCGERLSLFTGLLVAL